MWPFLDGDDTNVFGFIFSKIGSLSMEDFLLAMGELPEDEDGADAAAFLASINILDTSFDASGDFLSSFSDVLLLTEAVLLGLVTGDEVFVEFVVCFLENVE